MAGPSLWSKWYPVADLGDRQSPIDIITGCATPDPALTALKYAYDPAAIRLVNTGATWRMDFEPEGSNLSGGPLEGSYKGGLIFKVFLHCCWTLFAVFAECLFN